MISFSNSIEWLRAKKRLRGSRRKQWVGLIIVMALILYCVGDAFAQQPLGLIVGTVTDPTGASVSAVKVTVIQPDKQVSHTVVTDATGNYSLPFLVDGVYTIETEHPGFRVSVVSHVVLHAAQTVRADIQLQLGEVTEVSKVSAAAITLQTDSAVPVKSDINLKDMERTIL